MTICKYVDKVKGIHKEQQNISRLLASKSYGRPWKWIGKRYGSVRVRSSHWNCGFTKRWQPLPNYDPEGKQGINTLALSPPSKLLSITFITWIQKESNSPWSLTHKNDGREWGVYLKKQRRNVQWNPSFLCQPHFIWLFHSFLSLRWKTHVLTWHNTPNSTSYYITNDNVSLVT